MKLSPNFRLVEFTNSPTALRMGINNTPNNAQIIALRLWCENIGEPVRAHFKRQLKVNSGFRSAGLNAALGGGRQSQHMRGEAVDFSVAGVANIEVAKFIAENLAFDQLIAEHLKKADPFAGWVHCSYKAGKLRHSVLSCISKGKYVSGLIES